MPVKKSPFARLAKAKTALGSTIAKSALNPHFKSGYVPLPVLLPVVAAALEAEGLILVQPLSDLGRPGVIGVGTQVIDTETGDVLLDSVLPIPCDTSNPQKATAAVTYGRRTGITSLIGIAEKDDDGNAASAPAKAKARTATAAPGADIFG